MIGLLAQNPDYENGCYEQAYKLNSVALILVTVISSIMTSRNAHDYQKGDINSLQRHLYFASSYVWMVGIPLIVGFSVMSDNLSSWFLGEGYEKVPLLMQIMSVRFVLSGVWRDIWESVIYCNRKRKVLLDSYIFRGGI